MVSLDEDCKSLLLHIQFEEKQLALKRRWLMGLPITSKSDQKLMKEPKFLKNMSLPESLLRKDDVSYEIVKTYIARGFGVSDSQGGNFIVQDYLHLIDINESMSSIIESLPLVLDDMNNIGLCCLANICAQGSVNFEKTCLRMKRVIKEHLPKIIRNPYHNHHVLLRKQLQQLLTDPSNFQKNRVTLKATGHRSAAIKLLEGLENLPSQTLSAMHRKLRGAPALVPKLQAAKSGWNRDRLVEQLRTTCENMLSEISEADELQKPLAKAMTIASLSLQLELKNENVCMPWFCNFSKEIELRHREILKSIRFLDEMTTKDFAAKELKQLLDPKAKIPNAHFRPAVRRMLTGYLFECSEMDAVPKLLQEILDIINRNDQSDTTLCFSEKDIEDEVENVLIVSSQLRQIIWDSLGDQKCDEEFSEVYMEDIQENDDNDDYRSDYNCFQITGSCTDDELESVAESRPVDPPIDKNEISLLSEFDLNLNSNSAKASQHLQGTGPSMTDQHDCDLSSSFLSCDKMKFPHVGHNLSSNVYLAIQEISDEASLVGHRLIGHLLEAFLQLEGADLERSERSYLRGGTPDPEDSQVARETDPLSEEVIGGSVIVRAVEEILPSFPKSDLETVKELMGLK